MPTLDKVLERERLRNAPPSPEMQQAIDETRAAINAAFDSSESAKVRLVSADKLEAAQAEVARLSAEVERLRAALDRADACLSIVEPRTDRAEYLRTLDVVRTAISDPSTDAPAAAREGSE